MAMKLSILAVTLALVVLIARTTSASRTTITTVQVEDSYTLQQCLQELQGDELNGCQEYVRQQGRGYLALSTDNSNQQQQQQQQYEKQCCQELSRLSEQCQCDALLGVLMFQSLWGHLSPQQLQKLAPQVEDLPQRCQTGSQRCQLSRRSSRRLTF